MKIRITHKGSNSVTQIEDVDSYRIENGHLFIERLDDGIVKSVNTIAVYAPGSWSSVCEVFEQ